MDDKQAAAVLREIGDGCIPGSNKDALLCGAYALDFKAWLFEWVAVQGVEDVEVEAISDKRFRPVKKLRSLILLEKFNSVDSDLDFLAYCEAKFEESKNG